MTTEAVETKEQRGHRKVKTGKVVSNKMAKTIVVQVDRRMTHPKYHKVLTRLKHYYAHDEKNEAKIGDRVEIMETRPLSKLKRWRLVSIVQPAARN